MRSRIGTPETQEGSILVTILVMMMFMTSLLFSLLLLANANLSRARSRVFVLQAQYSAESGADAAIAALNSGNDTFTGTTSDVTVVSGTRMKATYSSVVAAGATGKQRVITATGKVYLPASATTPTYKRQIRVVAQRSSTSTASSVVSRNIIEIASGVKNLTARDIYVNNYINMNKNTTNLIADNITVGGKNTGATNCSIGGSGNLVKPTSFSNPGQTKTKLNLAFNNCINPPGNTSNANFDVSANLNTISTIQSTFVPWSQYMDGTYTGAGSCSDWTVGGTTRNIPSVSGSKKTHYPDSANSIASTCGSSGDISLGSNTYNITDNVHVRANFCAASACNPTFNNPTATVKYLFVEGTVNFDSVQTAPGSGPMVLIVYGADPASKTSVCPYGGALYIGGSGSADTQAPAMFFLANNGMCIDKTKFDSSPGLGGVGGKNVYVAANPSTPRDLALDPNFPVNQIPIDLTWRAYSYERL
jgi:hypothetical protein